MTNIDGESEQTPGTAAMTVEQALARAQSVSAGVQRAAAEAAAPAAAPTALGRSIVITSGKGGVGKTTTTANLGTGLAEAGKKVVVVDADIGLRNLDVVLGLENRVRKHLLDVIEKKCSLDEALVRDRVRRSLYLLSAAQNREKDDVPPAAMAELVRALREQFEFVLIDCPAGIEQGFRNAVLGALEAIIVTTPEVSAVRDADRVVGLLPEKIDVKLIINRVRPALVKKGTMMSVEDVNNILQINLIGVVPDEKEIIIATNRGTPVIDIPGSQTGAAFRRIVGRMLGESIPIPPLVDRSGSFLSRILSSFGGARS